MTDVTLLRKLTEKSKFGFGKYSILTVREILNLRHPNYIRWCYFNLDTISFTDNIINEVKIPENYRIEKPGKNPELGGKLEDEIFGRMYPLEKYILKKTIQKQAKRDLAGVFYKDVIAFSKGSLQRINHGHKK